MGVGPDLVIGHLGDKASAAEEFLYDHSGKVFHGKGMAGQVHSK
jgi:hypothetical protein